MKVFYIILAIIAISVAFALRRVPFAWLGFMCISCVFVGYAIEDKSRKI